MFEPESDQASRYNHQFTKIQGTKKHGKGHYGMKSAKSTVWESRVIWPSFFWKKKIIARREGVGERESIIYELEEI